MIDIQKQQFKDKKQFPLYLDNDLYLLIRKYSYDNNISINSLINDMIQYSLSTYLDSGINKLELLGFIQELEHNRKIPNSTRIDIDYVIDRLKGLFKEE